MEPDHPVPESSDEAITSTSTIDENSTQTSVRSYECNFCKRGFTNAQALGGHMNIHRKHKAKFKESSSSPPLNATAVTTTTTTTTTTGNPSSLHGENKPLPLFGEGFLDSRNVHQEDTTVDPPSSVPEVDLELRLGHIQSPENKISTRKFF